MGQLSRMLRFGGRFLTNSQYRNHVLDVVTQQVSRRPVQVAGLPPAEEAKWLEGKKIYLVGGCELTFFKEALERYGVITCHTFDHSRPVEPLAELSDKKSPIWDFGADYCVLSQAQRFRGLVQRLQTEGEAYQVDEIRDDLMALSGDLARAIAILRGQGWSGSIFIKNYLLGYNPVRGVLEGSVQPMGLLELLHEYDRALYQLAKEHPGVQVLDVNLALEQAGKDGAINLADADGMYEHFTRRGAGLVTAWFLRQVGALEPNLRRIKCAVFDLDDTVWAGVLREDGPAGVKVREHVLRIMRHFASRGMVLAICSKNDPVEKEHLPGLLGESVWRDILVCELSWEAKSVMLRRIAKQLNIGLDTLALFDDNDRERAEVAANASEVLVLREDEMLEAMRRVEFHPLGEQWSGEVHARLDRYRGNLQRQMAAEPGAENAEALADFLKDSRLVLSLREACETDVSRLEELLSRTNQLNATFGRTNRRRLQDRLASPASHGVFVARLVDRFGDYGLIGVGVVRKNQLEWEIEELAVSCRAMGRNVEQAMLLFMAEQAQAAGAETLGIGFQKSERNSQMLEALEAIGFKNEEASTTGRMQLPLDKKRPGYPIWLAVE